MLGPGASSKAGTSRSDSFQQFSILLNIVLTYLMLFYVQINNLNIYSWREPWRARRYLAHPDAFEGRAMAASGAPSISYCIILYHIILYDVI